MPNPAYVGELMMFGGNFQIYGWAFCNGSLTSISQNTTLFNLIGTTYGGDGVSTFGLPDFRSRIPIHMGQGGSLSNYVIGQNGGVESVQLNSATIPVHNHVFNATSAAANSQNISTTSLPANVTSNLGVDFYCLTGGDTTPGALAAASVTLSGTAGLAHENRMPSLCVSFLISLFGVYPSQN